MGGAELTLSLAGRGDPRRRWGHTTAPTSTSTHGGAAMSITSSRWYPVLLLRDALGRFVSLRAPKPPKPRRPRRPRLSVAYTGIQLLLFG